ncbi:MAG TPA: polysaccharide deacetylase family protein [Moheibacter sp.]|nr:polysaccharide deacetylase family protein [Moheibacter sp.]
MLKKILISFNLLYLGLFLTSHLLFEISLSWIFPLILINLIGIIWASSDLRLNFFLPAITQGKKGKIIALTFDDGPTEYTEELLDLLLKYNAKATFFCIGQQIEKHPEIAQRIHSEGHTIGNHTQNHPKNLGFLSVEKVKKEIETCHQTIQKYMGFSPKYYRPPFGVTNPNIAKALKNTHYTVIGWNNRSLDTMIRNKTQLFNRIYRKLPNRNLVLLHDTQSNSVEVVEQLLKRLTDENYIFVNIDDFLKTKHA